VAGVSGNPSGRPVGVPTAPEPVDAMLRRVGARHGRTLVRALLKAAQGGDVGAAGVLLSAIMRAEAPPP
jgi:hypothetical protein